MKRPQKFLVEVTDERRSRRNRVMELKIELVGGIEPFLAVASLYGQDFFLNLPASPDANAFIEYLSERVGDPTESPVIKCSAPWSEHMIGPMQTVTWKLDSQALEKLDLALLGSL